MKRSSWLLLMILFLASLFRLAYLQEYPPGLTNDEIGEVYSAYSIAETGRDLFGQRFPLSFNLDNSFPPVLIYMIAGYYKLFPFTPYAGRYIVAISGILTVYLLFKLTLRMTRNTTFALMAASVLAFSPWHIHLMRSSYGSALAPFFFLLAGYLFILMTEKKSYLTIILSLMVFLVAFATYHATKVIILPYIGLLLWYTWKIKQTKFITAWCGLILILFGIFSYLVFVINRPPDATNLIIGRDAEKIAKDVGQQRDRLVALPLIKWMTRNKPLYLYDLFTTQYLTAYSPEFFFTKGDGSGIYTIWGYGKQYNFEIVLFCIGLVMGLRILGKRTYIFIVGWFLIGGLPSALTTAPDSMRQIITVIPLAVIIACGFYWVWQKNKMLAICFSLLYVFFSARFFSLYIFDYGVNGAEYWFESAKRFSQLIEKERKNYDAVYISSQNTGNATSDLMTILQYATYAKINPRILQNIFSHSPTGTQQVVLGNVYFLGTCISSSDENISNIIPNHSLYLVRTNVCFKPRIKTQTIRTREQNQDIWWLYRSDSLRN